MLRKWWEKCCTLERLNVSGAPESDQYIRCIVICPVASNDGDLYVQSCQLAPAACITIAMSLGSELIMYVCFRAWRSLLLDMINPYHPSPRSQFPFFSPYLCPRPLPISSCWHRTASFQNGGINSGMRGVIFSLSFSLYLCSVCNAWPLS